MSQLPNLDSAVWASIVGMLCSFGYSFLCLGMSIWQIATCELWVGGGDGGAAMEDVLCLALAARPADHTITTVPLPSMPRRRYGAHRGAGLPRVRNRIGAKDVGRLQLVWRDRLCLLLLLHPHRQCCAVGRAVAPCSGGRVPSAGRQRSALTLLLPLSTPSSLQEISDTIKDSGKGPVWHMKRAVWVSVSLITGFYFLVSVLGYLAYGSQALYGARARELLA